jgi:hypothetical protein
MSNCKTEELVIDCGCENKPLTTAVQCDDFSSCEENACQEVFNEDCILRYSDNIKEQNISKGDSLNQRLEKIMLFINPGLSDTDSAIEFKSVKISKTSISFEWQENNFSMYGYDIELKEVISGTIFTSAIQITSGGKHTAEFINLTPGIEFESFVKSYYADLALQQPIPATVNSLTLLVKTLY